MVFFVGTLLAIFFVMHFYVFWRLFGLFGCRRRWGFWLLTVVASCALVGARMIEAYIDLVVAEILFVITAYALGLVWIAMSVLLCYEALRWVRPHRPRTGGIVVLAVIVLLAGYATVNARRITVNTVTVPGPDGLRIVQLSDIHIGSVNAAFIRRMVDKTNALNPDMVLITGDLVDIFSPRTQETMTLLAELEAPTFFVSGNHEYYAGRREILDALRRLDITVMDNRIEQIGNIQLIGLPDATDTAAAEAALLTMPYDRQAYSILMFHRPLDLAFLAQAGIDLTLVGHTHRGQIFPFGLIVRLFEAPVYGLHRHDDSFLYVTSGTGLWGPRLRLGTHNEIVLIEMLQAL